MKSRYKSCNSRGREPLTPNVGMEHVPQVEIPLLGRGTQRFGVEPPATDVTDDAPRVLDYPHHAVRIGEPVLQHGPRFLDRSQGLGDIGLTLGSSSILEHGLRIVRVRATQTHAWQDYPMRDLLSERRGHEAHSMVRHIQARAPRLCAETFV